MFDTDADTNTILIKTNFIEPTTADSQIKFMGASIYHVNNDISAIIDDEYIEPFKNWIINTSYKEIRVRAIVTDTSIAIHLPTPIGSEVFAEKLIKSSWLLYAVDKRGALDVLSEMVYGAFEYFKIMGRFFYIHVGKN